jgi:hypothetical protein
MFDNTILPTDGMLTAVVQHPTTKREMTVEFYIAKHHNQPILGLEACLQFDLLTVVEENICAVQQSALSNQPLTKEIIFQRYPDLFEGVGCMPGEVHLDVDPHVRPVQLPLRRLPEAIKEQVRCELDRLCKDDIIEPVKEPSEWISALMVTRKPDGRVRICICPKFLNEALKRSHMRMNTIDDVLPQLAKARVFSTVDAKDGYWQCKLDLPSRRLTTFETPFGRFRWKRLAMGLKVSSDLFAQKISESLFSLRGIALIADDILCYGCGDSIEEAVIDHDRNFVALLERCREKGIKLNKNKLQHGKGEHTFMGHCLTAKAFSRIFVRSKH